jgi:hypothetical protein
MYNKKTLLQAMAELNKAKAPKKSKDVITDPKGQWAHPGEITRIPSNNITMQGVNYPVMGIANTGQQQMMQPGEDYTFPGADYVDEYPQMRKGGQRKKRKTKSIMGKNKLMEIGPLFKDYSKRIYDPNVNYFQDGGSNKNLFDNIYTTINPFNWGVDDYSKIPDFKKAYQAARKNGQKEFIWNNTRYNTKYAGTPQQQLKETGITDDRLGVKNNRSDDAYNFVKPSVYKDVEDVKQHLSNYYNHRNRFDDTEYKKLQEEYIKEGKKKNYNIKKIKALESKLKAYEPAFFGEDDPYSEDGWRIYLGKPQTKNTFSISKYKPTKANDKSINYYSLPDEFKNDLFNLYEQHGYNLPQRKLLNEKFFPNVFGEESSRARVLGNFTVNKGKDDKGDYISYYDKYDLNPNLPIVGQVLSLDNYVGKPFEIYDRIYVKDYGDGKQKRMYYSDEELSELDATKRNFDTLALQKELLNRGYKLSKSTKNDGALDGVFGDETKQFLKEWQSKNKKQKGGEYIELSLTEDEINEYRKGGYIVEDISVPELTQAKKGGPKPYIAKNKKDYEFRKKAYDDSLAIYKLDKVMDKLSYENAKLANDPNSNESDYFKNVNKMNYIDAQQKKIIKNSNVPHKMVFLGSRMRGDREMGYIQPKQMIAPSLENNVGEIIYKPAPKSSTKKSNPSVSVKNNTLEISDPKEYAYRKKMYDDSLNLYNYGNKEKEEQLKTYGVAFPNYNKKEAVRTLNTFIKNRVATNLQKNTKIKPVGVSKDYKGQILIYKKPTQSVIFKKEVPSIKETPDNKEIVKVDNISKVTKPEQQESKYPKGYQPYRLYGRILDPEVYGYGESINSTPLDVAQFADTYGLKKKMDEYKKSEKYPWVKQEGGNIKTHRSKDGTITNTITKANGDTVIQIKTKDGKYFEKVKPGLPQFIKDEFKKRAGWENRSSGIATPVDDFWTLPMGMTSAGVKGTVGLVKGLTSLGRNTAKSSLAQTAKAGAKTFYNKSRIKSLPGSSWGNLLTSSGVVSGIGSYFDKDSDVRTSTKKAIENPTGSNVINAIGENANNALDFIGVGIGNNFSKVPKYINKLGKYAKIPTSINNQKFSEVKKAGIDGNFLTRPLTMFTKNELKATPQNEMFYRKIGNKKGLQDLIDKGGAQAPAPMRMTSGAVIDAPFFGMGVKPNENYRGVFAVELDPNTAKYDWSNYVGGVHNRGAVPFDPKTGKLLKNIPLENLNVYKKKWFSNNYRQLKPEEFEEAAKQADFQNFIENFYKWGVRGTAVDQIANEGKITNPFFDYLLSKREKKKDGGMVLELTPDEIDEYIKQGYTVEDVD